MRINPDSYGVGPTPDLSLRVSVATLNKVLFRQQDDERLMLALERTATLMDRNGELTVSVMAKPFGGGVRLNRPEALRAKVGDFHFDCQRSRSERDFRIFIRPGQWSAVQRFCRQHFQEDSNYLESQPERELVEEFEDTLQFTIRPGDYKKRPLSLILESQPVRTESIRSEGSPTVRIYFVYEICINLGALAKAILAASETISDEALKNAAWQDANMGGKGRANGILALPYHSLAEAFGSLPVERRGESIQHQGHLLAGNVVALFETVETTKYKHERLDQKGIAEVDSLP